MNFVSIRPRSALMIAIACLCFTLCDASRAGKAPKAPKPDAAITPKLNQKFFNKMPRAWVEIVKVDPEKNVLQVRTKKGELRDVQLISETTVHIRDSFGELSDLYPGESVMLFICPDAQGNWAYPRAVQDELQMMSSHGWKWTVEALDAKQGTVDLSRKEQSGNQQVVHESFRVSDATKVWKGETPAGLETLHVGDIVLFQTRYDAGQEKRFVVEFFDQKGLEVVKAAQLAKFNARLGQIGLPGVVNDLEVTSGAVEISIQPQAQQAGKEIKAGDHFMIERAGAAPIKFAASVLESHTDHKKTRMLLLADSFEIVRLRIGEDVRLQKTANDPTTKPAAQPAARD